MPVPAYPVKPITQRARWLQLELYRDARFSYTTFMANFWSVSWFWNILILFWSKYHFHLDFQYYLFRRPWRVSYLSHGLGIRKKINARTWEWWAEIAFWKQTSFLQHRDMISSWAKIPLAAVEQGAAVSVCTSDGYTQPGNFKFN